MEWNGKWKGKKLIPQSGMEKKGMEMEWKVEWKKFETSKWNGAKVEWKWNGKWNGIISHLISGMEKNRNGRWNGNGMEKFCS